MGGFRKTTDDVTVETVMEFVDHQKLWDSKEDWVAMESDSQDIWNDLSAEDRDDLIDLVVSRLEIAINRVEEWLPHSLAAKEPTYLDVKLRVLFLEVENLRARKEHLTRVGLKRAKDSVERILAERGEEVDD